MTGDITIREAVVGDAKALNDYIAATYKVARHLITRHNELRFQAFARRLWIAKKQLNELEICLVAEQDGQIVGMLESWTDRRSRVSHVTTFAMSVAATSQGRGIGKAILGHFTDWVRDHKQLRCINLHVHSDNLVARALYEKLGFEETGMRPAAILYEDGRVIDDHLMSLWPKGDRPPTTSPEKAAVMGRS